MKIHPNNYIGINFRVKNSKVDYIYTISSFVRNKKYHIISWIINGRTENINIIPLSRIIENFSDGTWIII